MIPTQKYCHRISPTDSKVRTTLHVTIIDSGSEFKRLINLFLFFPLEFTLDPVNTTSSMQNSTSIGLSWVPPDPYKLGEAISEYQVEVVDLLRGESINVTVNSSSLQLDFLKPFTNYEFKVFGSTSSWAGNLTDTISLKTQEDGT